MTIKSFFATLMIVAAAAITTDATAQKVAKISRVTMRSLNEISIVGEIDNNTPNDISVKDTKASLKLHGQHLAKLAQMGTATAPNTTKQEVEVVMRIESIDPMHAMTLMAMLSQMKFDGLTLDAEAHVTVGDTEQRIAQSNIDLTNIMSIFAPTQPQQQPQ